MLGFANLALQIKNQHQSRGIVRQQNSLINQSPLAQVPVVDWHCMFSSVSFFFNDNPGCLIFEEIRMAIRFINIDMYIYYYILMYIIYTV